MIIKFNSQNKPSYIEQDFLLQDLSKVPPIEIIGYHFYLNGDGDDIRINDGDYIIEENGVPVGFISAAEYALGNDATQLIKEHSGKKLLREIWKILSQSGLTDIQSADILNTISVTLIALLAGEVKAARIIANNTPTTANFTAARKSFLLGLIDTAITQL